RGVRLPRAGRELVDLIPGATAEQLGQVEVGGVEEVDGPVPGEERHPEGVVGLGQPDRVAERVDAALGVEADEAPGPLRARDRGDEDHGGVGQGDEALGAAAGPAHGRTYRRNKVSSWAATWPRRK